MHRIQLPSYYFLQGGRNFANQKIERPVCSSREGDTLRTDGKGKNLLLMSVFLGQVESNLGIPLGDTTTESDPS